MRSQLYLFAMTTLIVACQNPKLCPINTSQTSVLDQGQYDDPFRSGGKLQTRSPRHFRGVRSGANLRGFSVNDDNITGQTFTIVIDHSCIPEFGTFSSNLDLPDAAGLRGSSIRSHRLELPESISLKDFETQIEEDPCVVGVADFGELQTFEQPLDPDLKSAKHLETVQYLKTQPLFFDPERGIRKNVVIAIIDTGVETGHEDLSENMWRNPNEIPSNGKDDDQNGYVDDVFGYNFASDHPSVEPEGDWSGRYHGTHVAGLAAARSRNGKGLSGVMGENVQIMALNVFGADPGASIDAIDNAIRYAADNGAHVINMSLGGRGEFSSTESAIAYALQKGVTIVVAAGNDNMNLDTGSFVTPASYGRKFQGMITVGSIDVNGEGRSTFSNFGVQNVELGAPGSTDSKRGEGLYSTVLNNRYGRAQGTSMASPVTAGAAALTVGLIMSRNQKITPSLVEEMVTSSGRSLASLQSFFKSGRVVDLAGLYQTLNTRFPFEANRPDEEQKPLPAPDPVENAPETDSQPRPGPGQCPT